MVTWWHLTTRFPIAPTGRRKLSSNYINSFWCPCKWVLSLSLVFVTPELMELGKFHSRFFCKWYVIYHRHCCCRHCPLRTAELEGTLWIIKSSPCQGGTVGNQISSLCCRCQIYSYPLNLGGGHWLYCVSEVENMRYPSGGWIVTLHQP